MKKEEVYSSPYEFEGRIPLKQAIPMGLQHVLAMFVGNLTPILIISGVCGIAAGSELQITLLQNAMLIAGIVTLVQLFAIGPCGGKVPIIMGTSSGFIGVCNSVAGVLGGGVLSYGAIMGASIIGGLFEAVLGFLIKPLRKFFPPIITGTVVFTIGLSLYPTAINYMAGGTGSPDYGSWKNWAIAIFTLIIVTVLNHFGKGIFKLASILIGIICGYVVALMFGNYQSCRWL